MDKQGYSGSLTCLFRSLTWPFAAITQIAISVGIRDKIRFDPINNLSTSYRKGTINGY